MGSPGRGDAGLVSGRRVSKSRVFWSSDPLLFGVFVRKEMSRYTIKVVDDHYEVLLVEQVT